MRERHDGGVDGLAGCIDETSVNGDAQNGSRRRRAECASRLFGSALRHAGTASLCSGALNVVPDDGMNASADDGCTFRFGRCGVGDTRNVGSNTLEARGYSVDVCGRRCVVCGEKFSTLRPSARTTASTAELPDVRAPFAVSLPDLVDSLLELSHTGVASPAALAGLQRSGTRFRPMRPGVPGTATAVLLAAVKVSAAAID